eukprot:TRINITY_DN80074_c0_g1_i1.p1 TRINITY_DN80074_c0_g1~~TRINITY_DN80074_c0_g1_i1.p1  ORF type:complete len:371 (-),score=37.20 TRINITY_DN80074_c0_g1_i1:31-1143(-)
MRRRKVGQESEEKEKAKDEQYMTGAMKSKRLILLMAGIGALILWQAMVIMTGHSSLEDQPMKCHRRDKGNLQAMARDLAGFFRAEGITAHPWVLTLVGALRYGANTVEIDGGTHTVDHDIDIRVILQKNQSHIDMVNRLGVYLQAAGHWAIPCPCGITWLGQYNPCIVFLGSSTPLGWMQAVKLFPRVADHWLSNSVGTLPILGDFAKSVGWFFFRMLGTLLAPLWSMVTIVDLHVRTVENQLDPQFHALLWAGQRWEAPVGFERVFRYAFTVYINKMASRMGIRRVHEDMKHFCNFYLPQDGWAEDVLPSDAANNVSEDCGEQLHADGYFSFWELCMGSDSYLEELDQYSESDDMRVAPIRDKCSLANL